MLNKWHPDITKWYADAGIQVCKIQPHSLGHLMYFVMLALTQIAFNELISVLFSDSMTSLVPNSYAIQLFIDGCFPQKLVSFLCSSECVTLYLMIAVPEMALLMLVMMTRKYWISVWMLSTIVVWLIQCSAHLWIHFLTNWGNVPLHWKCFSFS